MPTMTFLVKIDGVAVVTVARSRPEIVTPELRPHRTRPAASGRHLCDACEVRRLVEDLVFIRFGDTSFPEKGPCQVVQRIGAKQAAAYAALNGNITKTTAQQIHHAKVAAGDEDVCG